MPQSQQREEASSKIAYRMSGGETLLLVLSGPWRSADRLPAPDEIEAHLSREGGAKSLAFDAGGLTAWDSGLLVFLIKVGEVCSGRGLSVDPSGLPEGAQRLLALASAVPERKGARREEERRPFLERVGLGAMSSGRSIGETVGFVGETLLAFQAFARGRASYLKSDLFLYVQEAGAQALPIVGLISFLVGIILAFVGAVQLELFGAQLYVADLVGIAMVRSMGAIMAGIIMAGRTGAAYASQLGTMQVNEEIDALRTLAISPMEFLVLPRMLALVLMMPLLCLFADLFGILGGAVVGVGMFDITLMEYYQRTTVAVPLRHVWIGLLQGTVYGVLVAAAGCLRGMQCGRSAWDVGAAATSAVVTGIVWIVTSCAIMTMIFNQLGV
jgi:phospholipid/cholesterol/gamma-HCH transport system permease protein